jgi:hypothetical protein
LIFANATRLNGARLHELFLNHTAPYSHEKLTVRVRYSRASPFSGACYYADSRIFINLGRRNVYPFTFGTHVARARTEPGYWWREVLKLTVTDAYQLALFVYLHELYHFLVKQAGRSPRKKEAMCDRFAARVLVDEYDCRLSDRRGRWPDRSSWDFQDLHAFVAAAPKEQPLRRSARKPIPVTVRGLPVPQTGLLFE